MHIRKDTLGNMSWSRFLEGDVYVYEDVSGGVTCCGCPLGIVGEDALFPASYNTSSVKELSEHFEAHKQAGHAIPARLWDNFRAWIAKDEGRVREAQELGIVW